MRNAIQKAAVVSALLLAARLAVAEAASPRMAFTVSMERPGAHYFHVELRCDGLTGETQDFKLPVWTPGYYMVMDYARNIFRFDARDGAGRPLRWEKTARNAWRVVTGKAETVVLRYDVYAFATSVAESSLDDGQAFISPTSVFLYAAGRLDRQATVTIVPAPGWRISTGLAPVPGRTNTFAATDFDVLYDSPILVGNQEILSFDVRGVRHEFVGRNLGTFDRTVFVADLAKMVESAVSLMGEMPYDRYVFIAIGPGGGGLEHLNSQAITFDGNGLKDPAEYRKVLRFLSHEYFHHYNVKRIRPVGFGPFDYDREPFTSLLWVSEGLTVYYEDLVLRRNGFHTEEQFLEQLRLVIAGVENSPGRGTMSATEASLDAFSGYFGRNEHQLNTAVSYYDKGCILGVLLDLAIRHESGNRMSLDDAMRALYRTYYKEKKRGFTDREFRDICESVAGAPLPQIFDVYAATPSEIDYRKYFEWAGLDIDLEPKVLPGARVGVLAKEQDGRLVVTRVEPESPASAAGLSLEDEILALDGVRANARRLDEALKARKPGDTLHVLVARRGTTRTFDVALGETTERTFRITPMKNPDPLQVAIRRDWLRGPGTPKDGVAPR